jgi:hypothetical protein
MINDLFEMVKGTTNRSNNDRCLFDILIGKLYLSLCSKISKLNYTKKTILFSIKFQSISKHAFQTKKICMTRLNRDYY